MKFSEVFSCFCPPVGCCFEVLIEIIILLHYKQQKSLYKLLLMYLSVRWVLLQEHWTGCVQLDRSSRQHLQRPEGDLKVEQEDSRQSKLVWTGLIYLNEIKLTSNDDKNQTKLTADHLNQPELVWSTLTKKTDLQRWQNPDKLTADSAERRRRPLIVSFICLEAGSFNLQWTSMLTLLLRFWIEELKC